VRDPHPGPRRRVRGFVLYLPPRTQFGVMIYGYGQYTSDWYPGGLDLKSIPQ